MLKNPPFYDLWGLLGGRDCHKEWALATASPCRPRTSPAGTLLVPLSSVAPLLRRIDPLWGLCPPLPPAAAPPFWFSSWETFEKSFSFRPRRGKEQRGVAGDLLANRSTLPQPPRGRNACYGVLREGLRDRKRSVPGTPKAWQAGTPLIGGCAVPSRLNGHCRRVNRLSGD